MTRALILALACSFFAVASQALAIDFSVKSLDGKHIAKKDYQGKILLVDFWATWCAPCLEEIPEFNALQTRYASQGLQVLGLSMDDGPDAVKKLQKKIKFQYPVAMADPKTLKNFGGVLGLPVLFIFDRQGKLLSRQEGELKPEKLEKEIKKLLQTP